MTPKNIRIVCGAGMILAAVPFVLALGMTLFHLFKDAEESQPLFDLYIPDMTDLLLFEAACVVLFAASLVGYLKFGKVLGPSGADPE